MADAGRILIIPRGDYDANSTYEKLDLVKYKGTSWLAKKNATGVEPSEGEYWQKMLDNLPKVSIYTFVADSMPSGYGYLDFPYTFTAPSGYNQGYVINCVPVKVRVLINAVDYVVNGLDKLRINYLNCDSTAQTNVNIHLTVLWMP